VINFSISGSRTSSVDAVEAAFFGAADAGVFVSTSAGNDGPGASTVAHNTPWEMSVAAGTLDRANNKTVTLGDGQSFTGVGLGAAVPSSPIALSSTVGLAGQDPDDVRLCFLNSLDPAKVAGKIIVCDRGVNDRVEKSAEVARPAASGWCWPTPRPTRSTPTSTRCRPCTSTRSPAPRSRRTCPAPPTRPPRWLPACRSSA
jgi:hypothetical protein